MEETMDTAGTSTSPAIFTSETTTASAEYWSGGVSTILAMMTATDYLGVGAERSLLEGVGERDTGGLEVAITPRSVRES